jgi:putative transposase
MSVLSYKFERFIPLWDFGQCMSIIVQKALVEMLLSVLVFRTKVFRNPIKTTFSSPYSRYRNLLVDKKLTDINQLWTSDLTYFKVGKIFYYIVFIIDVYSRVIVGYSVADNMRAENNVIALQMAFQYRKCSKFNYRLTHHSDRGGQYISE